MAANAPNLPQGSQAVNAANVPQGASAVNVPVGWEKRVSHTGKNYYLNLYTKETQWDIPKVPADNNVKKIKCSHLLVKHNKSRRPANYKGDAITRTKDEALKLVKGHMKKIKAGANFSELAEANSDCSSAKRGGDLGSFGPNQMQKAFEDVAFGLDVGELSGIVETESGYHIIIRTA